MTRKSCSWSLNLGVLTALFVLIATVPVRAAWQQEWQKVLAAARKEGTVFVSGPPGADQREAITQGWAKAFSDIELKYTGARGTQIIPKVARERQAGVFNWDIILASGNPTLLVFKPINALAPLRDALIIPERWDDKTWIHGFDTGFIDDDGRKFLYGAFGTAGTNLGFANRDCVSEEKFNKAADMAKPEFAGKIGWYDPTRPGSASRSTWVLSVVHGEEWLAGLFKKQDITFSRDYRQMADWAISCRKPIVIGLSSTSLRPMQKQGIGKNVKEIGGPAFFGKLNPGGAGGNASIAWYNNAPHPNAAKVFVNWYLSREAQQLYADLVETNSRRLDTQPRDPDPTALLKPDVEYFNYQNESSTEKIRALQEKIAQWGVLRKR